MNPTIDLLLNRKSVRAYAQKPIPEEEKQVILQATLRAPTAGNMMLYSIIEVEDQAIKERLAVTCDDQPFIARAPFVLLFLGDYQRWFDYYLHGGVEQLCQERGIPFRFPQEGDLLLACMDCLIAAHTAVIAAESLGIGSCYIGDIIEHFEEHQKLFNLPRYVLPVSLLCFGYPTPEAAERKITPRFDQKFIVTKNEYHRLEGEELDQWMSARNELFTKSGNRKDGIANVGQFNYVRKFSHEFSIEMTRSVRAMFSSWCSQD